MLGYIAARFIIKGAVKSFLINPAISATLSLVPSAKVVNYSLLGQNLILSTNDLLKFGFEKLYERYGEKKLTFNLKKMENGIYQIIPANDLAALFFKEYSDMDELLVDLDIVDKYLEILAYEDLQELNELENSLFEEDEAVLQILHDMDKIVVGANKFQLQDKEQELIDEVLNKNMGIVAKSVKSKREKIKLTKENLEIDLPKARFTPKTDKEKIDEILSRLEKEVKTSKKKRVYN